MNHRITERLKKTLQLVSGTRAVALGEGVLSEVPALFKAQFPGKTACLVADPRTFEAAGAAVESALTAAGLIGAKTMVLDDEPLIAEMRHVDVLTEGLATTTSIPVAVGAGTINDLVKLAATQLERPYMIVGTAASMDGYTSFGASISVEGNKQTMPCAAPRVVLADLDVMRRAPSPLLAAGYADLMAKIVAGADWILADALDIEPIDRTAWNIAQASLDDALKNPKALIRGDVAAFEHYVEALMMSGLAMQWSGSSRPASGAEHQFSHMWDIEHHVYQGAPPSHGFKVGVATHFIAALYEQVLEYSFDRLDIKSACDQWPPRDEAEAEIRSCFGSGSLTELALRESGAKWITRQALEDQLQLLGQRWPELRRRLQPQLRTAAEIRRRLEVIGAPVSPPEIGVSRQRMIATAWKAQKIRRRYTILDFCLRTGVFKVFLENV